jgi:hypothetical protein
MTEPVTRDFVTQALRDPTALPGLTGREWELLVRQARRADLLGRLGSMVVARGLMPAVPEGPRRHFEGILILSHAQRDEVLREVRYLRQALTPAGIGAVLLKGAAYVAADLPACAGRLFSDTDILVPKAMLPEVESNLMMRGWVTTHLDPYDQRYYREWMHELPPMEHMRRGTVVDVHHTILPETARLKPDAAKLLAAAQPVPGLEGVSVLAPPDMVLHSATHLFHNEELSHSLRDLSDLDLLLRHFGATSEFWPELVERARELDLARPLYYALHCAKRILGTPIPEHCLSEAARGAPSVPVVTFMDALWWRALRSQHQTAAAPFTDAALFLLYLRAHWLRMPPLLLARHLAVKAWRRSLLTRRAVPR